MSTRLKGTAAGRAISISCVDGDRTERRDSTREPARVAVACASAHTNSIPPQLCHQLYQPSARSGTAAALRDLQDVEHGLGGDALDAILTDLT